ncbi:MAG: GntR family transcriptional regulator [Gammaproteobacteria bacterium]|nr:GntR family transcriptional regulator [Gammaproteobacteria bacterium]
MPPDQPISRQPLYLEVAERVRQRIYRRQLVPGDWIDEKQLCENLQISRTPLREAIKVLHAEGLVELVPRRGAFIKKLETDGLRELFPVMANLEGLCARFAAQHGSAEDLAVLEGLHQQLETIAEEGDVDRYFEINHEFHTAVQNFARNRWLSRITADLRGVLRLARQHQLSLSGRLGNSLAEHREIMNALRQRDSVAAERAMHDHLMRQQQVLLEQDPEFLSLSTRCEDPEVTGVIPAATGLHETPNRKTTLSRG